MKIAETLETVHTHTHTHTIHLQKQYAKNEKTILDEINKREESYIINGDNRHYYWCLSFYTWNMQLKISARQN